MSRARVVGLGAVALVHVILGYALITGLATRAVKLITEPMKTVNIKEEVKPPEEPPPPPPKDVEIPPFVPPPEVTIQTDTPPPPAPPRQSFTPTPPPQPPHVEAPPAVVAPPAPKGPTQAASFNARSLEVSEDDYPAASLRAEEQGVVRVSVNIDASGKVIACNVTQSSNFPKLDEKTCQIAMRRWRGKPALQDGTPVASTLVKAVRWQVNTK